MLKTGWKNFGMILTYYCRVPSEEDVAQPKRNHPQHPRGHCLPWAHPLQDHPPLGPRLDPGHCHRPSRLWWPVQSHRLCCSQGWQSWDCLHPHWWIWTNCLPNVQLQSWRSSYGNVQHWRVDPRVRSFQFPGLEYFSVSFVITLWINVCKTSVLTCFSCR